MEQSESLQIVRGKADGAAKWLAVFLGFSLPISTAADSVILALIFALWLLSAGFRHKLLLIRENTVALLSLALLGLYILGLSYGVANRSSLTDVARFLIIPLFITLFQDEKVRHYALWGFLSALLLTLLLSYLLWLDLLPAAAVWKGIPTNPVIFHTRITHSLLMAFGAFIFSLFALSATSLSRRIFFALCAALALFNVLFMVQGRTGQVVALALAVFFFWNFGPRRGLIIPAAMVILIFAFAVFFPSSALHQRFFLAATEFSAWHPGNPSSETSSIGMRMEFYKNSLEIIRKHPFFGVGVGGFTEAYAAQVKNTGMTATENPHNEYLMMMVQLGITGLGLLLLLFTQQWRLATLLPNAFERAAARGLVLTIVVASMVSSTLIDHTEGLFYFWMSALLYANLSGNGEPKVA